MHIGVCSRWRLVACIGVHASRGGVRDHVHPTRACAQGMSRGGGGGGARGWFSVLVLSPAGNSRQSQCGRHHVSIPGKARVCGWAWARNRRCSRICPPLAATQLWTAITDDHVAPARGEPGEPPPREVLITHRHAFTADRVTVRGRLTLQPVVSMLSCCCCWNLVAGPLRSSVADSGPATLRTLHRGLLWQPLFSFFRYHLRLSKPSAHRGMASRCPGHVLIIVGWLCFNVCFFQALRFTKHSLSNATKTVDLTTKHRSVFHLVSLTVTAFNHFNLSVCENKVVRNKKYFGYPLWWFL